MTHHMRALVDRAHTRADGPIRFVAATEGLKADGIDLRMAGADLSRFAANPVILWAHDRSSPPIGRGTAAVDGSSLMIDVEFDQGDDFARGIERKVRDGFLNAGSIGFDFDWRAFMDADDGVVDEWSLLEFSMVPVPMDDKALVSAGRCDTCAARDAAAGEPDGGGAGGIDLDRLADLIADRLATRQDAAPGTDPDPDPDPGSQPLRALLAAFDPPKENVA